MLVNREEPVPDTTSHEQTESGKEQPCNSLIHIFGMEDNPSGHHACHACYDSREGAEKSFRIPGFLPKHAGQYFAIYVVGDIHTCGIQVGLTDTGYGYEDHDNPVGSQYAHARAHPCTPVGVQIQQCTGHKYKSYAVQHTHPSNMTEVKIRPQPQENTECIYFQAAQQYLFCEC